MIVQCACLVGDAARAKQAWQALPAGKLKTDAQHTCAQLGVKL